VYKKGLGGRAAMEVMARASSGLHCALARLHKRLAALERFIGCEVGGNGAESLRLNVNLEECSSELVNAYGREGLALTYLSVYSRFAVLVVGSAGAMYKSNAEFNHHVDGTHYTFHLKGASADAITLQGYMREFPSVMAYEAAFSPVTAPWEGEWVVAAGGVLQVAKYPLFGGGEADAWEPGCAEIVIDHARITFRWNGGKELAWDIKDVQPASFDVVVECGERHGSIRLRFEAHARDYNHLHLRVVRGGVAYVMYALERKERVVLRPLPPPVADAAEKRVILSVAEWQPEKPELQNLFKDWRKQVKLCVHKKCALLELGKDGRPFKQEEDPFSNESYRSLVNKLDSENMLYLHETGSHPISFKLTGGQFRIVLLCYYTKPPLSGHVAFNIPFVPCNVWEGDWSVQAVTPLDAESKDGKWKQYNAVNLTDKGWMKLAHPSGVTVTGDLWRIDDHPGQLWFRASQSNVAVACHVQVEDYNHIKLHIQTESKSAASQQTTALVPTVEYTLARKHTF
jgi:hypothetical protein